MQPKVWFAVSSQVQHAAIAMPMPLRVSSAQSAGASRPNIRKWAAKGTAAAAVVPLHRQPHYWREHAAELLGSRAKDYSSPNAFSPAKSKQAACPAACLIIRIVFLFQNTVTEYFTIYSLLQ